MDLPTVAIVGRPNVGKSALFNWLAGRRISIVDPTAGVTRDPFLFYTVAAALYLVLTSLSTVAFDRAERYSNRGVRRA